MQFPARGAVAGAVAHGGPPRGAQMGSGAADSARMGADVPLLSPADGGTQSAATNPGHSSSFGPSVLKCP